MSEILAYAKWGTNADLIADVARLGYLRQQSAVLDPTYGYGTWWKNWQPDVLLRHDLDPAKAPDGAMDFTDLLYADGHFEAVVFDPPYKMSGTPTPSADERYGIHEGLPWQDRIDLAMRGMYECARVVRPGGILLVKCQAQVVSGRVRWQDIIFATHGEAECGLILEDRFNMLGHRAQPANNPDGSPRRQVHARQNASQLLVFSKPRPKKAKA